MRVASFVLAAIVTMIMLGGCSYAPKPEKSAAADYGRPMTATEMQSMADASLVRTLKDPESRRVEWGRSGRAWQWHGAFGGGHRYGYGLLANVNAKNSFGGYVGAKPYFFFFRDGTLLNANVYLSDIYGLVE